MSHTECGIVGLPNVGKSGLFNALTGAGVASCNYPFCTIDPNVGIVSVKDDRLDQIAILSKSEKIIYADVKFVDIAGLVKGAANGEGLGNKFLSHVRETHAIAHVVRCFENSEITHVSGKIDPEDDIAIINLELILSDLSAANSIFSKVEKLSKGKKDVGVTLSTLEKVILHLESEKPLRTLELSEVEKEVLKPYSFITRKPLLYVANIDEDSLLNSSNNEYVAKVEKVAREEGALVVPICVRLEEELSALSTEEAQELLESMGLKESGLKKLIRSTYDTLGLISYFTTGVMESRAWTICKGTKAPEAAAAIHTDISKGFIRAEVIGIQDFIECQGRAKARESGKLRAEGKDYVVEDGDVILFLHN